MGRYAPPQTPPVMNRMPDFITRAEFTFVGTPAAADGREMVEDMFC